MTRSWFVRIVAPIAVGAMLLGACGGDDGTTSTAAGGATDTATDGGDDDGGGIFDAAQCAEAVQAWGAAAAAAGAAMGQGAGDMGASVEQLQAVAAAAPEEIRDDLTIVYEAYAAFVTALEDSGYDPTSGAVPNAEQIAAIDEASQSLNDAGVQEASDRVSAWFDSNCSG